MARMTSGEDVAAKTRRMRAAAARKALHKRKRKVSMRSKAAQALAAAKPPRVSRVIRQARHTADMARREMSWRVRERPLFYMAASIIAAGAVLRAFTRAFRR